MMLNRENAPKPVNIETVPVEVEEEEEVTLEEQEKRIEATPEPAAKQLDVTQPLERNKSSAKGKRKKKKGKKGKKRANKDLPDEEAIPLDERPPRPSRINTSGHKKSEDASLMKEQIDQLTEEKKTLEA